MNMPPPQATRMSALQLQRSAEKAKQQYLQFEAKAKAAIRAGNLPLARTHGESAMRCKSEAMTYLRLQAQVEGAQSKLASADAQRAAVGHLGETASLLEQAVPAGALAGVAATMERYGDAVEGLDVQTGVMDAAFDETAASSAPAAHVDELLRGIAAEHAIDTKDMLPAVPQGAPGALAAPAYGAQHGARPGVPQARALPK